MRAYEITFQGAVRYAGTQAEARVMKNRILENAGLDHRPYEVTIQEVDIPTSKAELLTWINNLAVKADPKVEHPKCE
jgi:hypothetical protein